MKKQLFAYKDNSVAFGDPFIQTNEKVAVRDFIGRAQETPRNVLNDIDLYYLGEYDDETGEVTNENKLLLKGSSIVKESEKDGM